jgi:hypothetical protein
LSLTGGGRALRFSVCERAAQPVLSYKGRLLEGGRPFAFPDRKA